MTPRDEEMWRLFVAVPIADAVLRPLDRYVQRLRREDWADRFRWMHSDAWHITLAFLGPTSPARIGGIKRSLASVAVAEQAFNVELSGFGRFPPRGTPRVFWYGVADDGGRLERLANCVTGALNRDPEREFRPHLTLARLRRGRPPTKLELPAIDGRAVPLTVDRLNLYRSHTRGDGPLYETLHSEKLALA